MDFVSILIYVAVAALGYWARSKGVMVPKLPAPSFHQLAPVQSSGIVTTDPAPVVAHRVTLSVPFEITLTPKEK